MDLKIFEELRTKNQRLIYLFLVEFKEPIKLKELVGLLKIEYHTVYMILKEFQKKNLVRLTKIGKEVLVMVDGNEEKNPVFQGNFKSIFKNQDTLPTVSNSTFQKSTDKNFQKCFQKSKQIIVRLRGGGGDISKPSIQTGYKRYLVRLNLCAFVFLQRSRKPFSNLHKLLKQAELLTCDSTFNINDPSHYVYIYKYNNEIPIRDFSYTYVFFLKRMFFSNRLVFKYFVLYVSKYLSRLSIPNRKIQFFYPISIYKTYRLYNINEYKILFSELVVYIKADEEGEEIDFRKKAVKKYRLGELAKEIWKTRPQVKTNEQIYSEILPNFQRLSKKQRNELMFVVLELLEKYKPYSRFGEFVVDFLKENVDKILNAADPVRYLKAIIQKTNFHILYNEWIKRRI